MIDRHKYVFILGAGASQPLGFPSSSELYQGIQQEFIQEVELMDRRYPFYEKMFFQSREFCNAIGDTPVYSIDKYINTNKKFKSIGAAAIATAIYRAEINSKRPDRRDAGDWYTYLFDKMIEGLDDSDALLRIHENRVAFITFNCDRSLEHFLFRSLFGLVRNDDKSQEDVASAINKIPILHVFGQIGHLPWQVGHYDDSEGFFDQKTHVVNFGDASIVPAMVGSIFRADIHLMYDERQESDNLKRIRELVDDAYTVLFLGFGYASENLRLLEIPVRLKGKRVFGTAMGKVKNEINSITTKLLAKDPTFQPEIRSCDCLGLLRDTLP